MSYLKRRNYTVPTQQEPLDELQVENSAGGFSYQIDKWSKFARFLILGTKGGSFYQGEETLTSENIKNLKECLQEDGLKVIAKIHDVAVNGKAPKRDQFIYSLAYAFWVGSDDTKKEIKAKFTEIINTGTDLLMFVDFSDSMRGWGRSLRNLVSSWYTYKAAKGHLEYQVLKYQRRQNWSHRDVLRKCHLGTNSIANANSATLRWVVDQSLDNREVTRKNNPNVKAYGAVGELPALLQGYEQMKVATTEKEVINLINEHSLTHEMVPNQWKDSKAVWESLLTHMPLTALTRNLNKMTAIELLTPYSNATKVVEQKLSKEAIQKTRIHPLQMLVARMTYSQGRGVKGSLTWKPVGLITDLLDAGFAHSFDNVVPTNKNIMLALDISSSMTWGNISGAPNVTPAQGAAAMALVTAKTEKYYEILGFNTRMTDLHISANDTFESAMKKTQVWEGGGTDCSMPILEAQARRLELDGIVIYTDSETWAGRIHPKDAFDKYRKEFDRPECKFIVVSMLANDFTLAHPEDRGMLDLVGFDTSSPNLISSFIRGELDS